MNAAEKKRASELTVRGLILGVLMTLIFTAANVYLGLKVGLTFATSIPAAVISMAVLAAFKDSSILENNIVQTVASAAGTLSAIIFVLPGLVIIGWWEGFPFWTSFFICASGGVLGVLFTVPLRRAMISRANLPFPEGVAAAQVLQVGDTARKAHGKDPATTAGVWALILGTVSSMGMAALVAVRLAANQISLFFRIGPKAVSGFTPSFSLALLGAGYLVGLSVGLAMLLGLLIAWGVAVPYYTAIATPTQDIGALAMQAWHDKVRFIGAGAIGVAAIWTLANLAGPLVGSVIGTLRTAKLAAAGTDPHDTDISPTSLRIAAIVCLVVIFVLLQTFLSATGLAPQMQLLIAATLPFIFVGGFLVAAITGYMAGLIGSSNSPISGIGILIVVLLAGLLLAVSQPSETNHAALTAYALFATAILFSIATISNDNLQDLKTGQMIGASPRAQQWALIVGVIAGSAVIPPILDLLAQAFGFVGQAHPPHGIDQALGAPQANLIAALAQGVIERDIDWGAIGIGAVLGLGLVTLDDVLGYHKKLRIPPLAVGIGIYLPMAATLPVVIGAVLGHAYNRWSEGQPSPEHAKRLAVLVSSGLIVGESLFGVATAGLIVATGEASPLGIMSGKYTSGPVVGAVLFCLMIFELGGWLVKRAKVPPEAKKAPPVDARSERLAIKPE